MMRARSPAASCCVAGEASTEREVIVPLTLPDCGQVGVPAGPGSAVVPQSQITIGPFTAICAKWMCPCCTAEESPEKVSVYSIDWRSPARRASNVPRADVETDGTSWKPTRSAWKSNPGGSDATTLVAARAAAAMASLFMAILLRAGWGIPQG